MNKLQRIITLVGIMVESVITIILLIPLMVLSFVIMYAYHKIKNIL